MKVAVIGSSGFVGGALYGHFKSAGIDVLGVSRANYQDAKSGSFDVVINCSNNSKKFVSDREPMLDFDLSVAQQMRVLCDFDSQYHVLMSSVDVYDQLSAPSTTSESQPVNNVLSSHYGFHKLLAEELTRHYSKKWLVVRLAGMVGPNLKKNPVFDILNNRPVFIHPESKYQFMHTTDVAEITLSLVNKCENEIINVCGNGLISPKEIAQLTNRQLMLAPESATSEPRVVDINIEKLQTIQSVPATRHAIDRYLKEVGSQ